VSASDDFTLWVWDLEAGEPLGGPLEAHENFVNAVALGELHGRPIAVSGGNDKTLWVWDLEAGGLLGGPLVGHEGWVNAVAVGELGGRPVAVSGGNDEMVRVWDLAAGEPLGEPFAGHEDWSPRWRSGKLHDRLLGEGPGKPLSATRPRGMVPHWAGLWPTVTEGRSHSDTSVGCIVWFTTASSSPGTRRGRIA